MGALASYLTLLAVSLLVRRACGIDNSSIVGVHKASAISMQQGDDTSVDGLSGLQGCAALPQGPGAHILLQVASSPVSPLAAPNATGISVSGPEERTENVTHEPSNSQPQLPAAAALDYRQTPTSHAYLKSAPTKLPPYVITLLLITISIGLLLLAMICCASSFRYDFKGMAAVEDPISYNAEGLLRWRICLEYVGTIWENGTLWSMVRRLTAVSIGTAFLELMLVPDPSSLDPMRFSDMGRCLNMFVALLVGFFLASSANRWFSGVNGFLSLFEAILQLQMQLHSLGAPEEKIDLAMRYGVLSAWVLMKSLESVWSNPADVWQELENSTDPRMYIRPEERALLEPSHDPACHFWMLVASLIGRMSQDGEIPAMNSPTYGRIVALAQYAQDSMKEVRQVGQVQMPYVYTHTLAVIVHLNNFLCAVSLGLTMGACIGSILVHIDGGLHFYSKEPEPDHILVQDYQDILIQFFQCFMSPVLFMAFLEIGVSLSTPLSGKQARIPAKRLFNDLLEDLSTGNRIAANPPLWKKPYFRVTGTETEKRLQGAVAQKSQQELRLDEGQEKI